MLESISWRIQGYYSNRAPQRQKLPYGMQSNSYDFKSRPERQTSWSQCLLYLHIERRKTQDNWAPVGDFLKGESKEIELPTGAGMCMPPGCHQVENVGDCDVEVLFLDLGKQNGETPKDHIACY